jgi:DnaJ homolog subfamily C member 17
MITNVSTRNRKRPGSWLGRVLGARSFLFHAAMKATDGETPDYYKAIELQNDATAEEITKAYRKRVLKLHPDKNRNDPKATEKFQALLKAYEVLSDEKARAAYDAVIATKRARQQRDKQMDGKLKRMKDDLETKENAWKKQRLDEDRAKRAFEAEMDRLRQQGWKKLREEQHLQSQMASMKHEFKIPSLAAAIKVKWDATKVSFDEVKLQNIFIRFGEIDWIQAKTQSAVILYKAEASAAAAMNQLSHPLLELSWVDKTRPRSTTIPPPASSVTSAKPTAPAAPAAHSASFEADVLAKMMAAAAAQRKAAAAPPKP